MLRAVMEPDLLLPAPPQLLRRVCARIRPWVFGWAWRACGYGSYRSHNARTGEFWDVFQMSLRRRSPTRWSVFAGFANAYWSYFPTIDAAARGGYGASYVAERAP